MIRLIYTVMLVMVVAFQAVAQQEARYSQFMFNKLALNPAYAGARGHLSMGAFYRHQWTGIDDAPQTLSLTVHAPLKNRRLALGGQLIHDRLGLTQTTGLYGDYGYRIPMGRGNLSMGLQAGMVNQRMDLTESNPLDGSDPTLQVNQSRWLPNAGLGLYYNSPFWYAGLSAPQLFEQPISNAPGSQARQARHYFAMGGYRFKVNPDVSLHPQALILYAEGAPVQAEANLSILIADHFWTGFGYRTTTTAVFNMAYEMTSGLRIGYAYDILLGNLGTQSGGSHEVMIGMDIGRNAVRMYTPRQLSSPVF